MSRYLITGATGFLGAHLVETVKARGHEVVALARDVESLQGAGVTAVAGDILDESAVRAAAKGCSGVFHCAGIVSRKAEDAETLHRVHVQGTRTVLSVCKAEGVKRAVVASTSGTVAVSDDPDHVANEDDPTPIGIVSRFPYYRAKLFAERAALEMNGDDFTVVCVNPTLLLGPGDVRGSSTEDVRLFMERRIPAVPPGGMSYVDARDAAEAMWLAMEKGIGGRRYLIGACNLTLREFFARLERVSGVRAPFIPMPRSPELTRASVKIVESLARRIGLAMPVDPISVDMAQFYWYLDATRAETELGWKPRDPITTLSDTVKDLRARGVVWPEAEGPSVLRD